MATPNIVPRADSEGGLGTSSKYWASAYIDTYPYWLKPTNTNM